MEFQEILNQAWVWVTSIVGSISLSTILSFFIALINSNRIKKAIASYRAGEVAELATDKGIERIKSMTFSHDIQPLVESELEKINEHSVKVLKAELNVVKEQYAHLVGVLEALAKYFENAYGVSDETKAELKAKVEEAKEDTYKVTAVASSVVVEEKPVEKQPQPVASATIKTVKASR